MSPSRSCLSLTHWYAAFGISRSFRGTYCFLSKIIRGCNVGNWRFNIFFFDPGRLPRFLFVAMVQVTRHPSSVIPYLPLSGCGSPESQKCWLLSQLVQSQYGQRSEYLCTSISNDLNKGKLCQAALLSLNWLVSIRARSKFKPWLHHPEKHAVPSSMQSPGSRERFFQDRKATRAKGPIICINLEGFLELRPACDLRNRSNRHLPRPQVV